MVSALVQIVVGLILWKIAPTWIQTRSRKSKKLIKLCLNIIGIVIVFFGVVSLLKALFSKLI